MADGACASEPLQLIRCKHLGDQPHSFMDLERPLGSFGGNDSRTFLSAVLEREQPVVCQQCGVGVAENSKNAAFIFWFVVRGRQRVQIVRGHIEPGLARDQGLNTQKKARLANGRLSSQFVPCELPDGWRRNAARWGT